MMLKKEDQPVLKNIGKEVEAKKGRMVVFENVNKKMNYIKDLYMQVYL